MTQGTRQRRSTVEVRASLLAAAEAVFAEHGFAAATTRQVAAAAGVSESVLYRHFPTKGGMFAAAVLTPFLAFLDSFSETSARYLSRPLDSATMMRLFVGELVDQLTEHRAALRMFLAADEQLDADTKAEFTARFDAVMRRLGEVVRTEGALRGREQRVLGSEMNVRATVGMVLSLVVLDDWLLPTGDDRPPRDQLVEHLCAILLQGT